MPKRTPQQKRMVIRVVNAPLMGPAIMRQITAHGVTAVALPHAPAATHRRTPQPQATQTHATGKHSSGGQGMTAAEVVQTVLAALQSGPMRQVVEAIAEHVMEQTQTRAASIMQQGGAYQRQGGF